MCKQCEAALPSHSTVNMKYKSQLPIQRKETDIGQIWLQMPKYKKIKATSSRSLADKIDNWLNYASYVT